MKVKNILIVIYLALQIALAEGAVRLKKQVFYGTKQVSVIFFF